MPFKKFQQADFNFCSPTGKHLCHDRHGIYQCLELSWFANYCSHSYKYFFFLTCFDASFRIPSRRNKDIDQVDFKEFLFGVPILITTKQ